MQNNVKQNSKCYFTETLYQLLQSEHIQTSQQAKTKPKPLRTFSLNNYSKNVTAVIPNDAELYDQIL